jgi:hypothetical protein
MAMVLKNVGRLDTRDRKRIFAHACCLRRELGVEFELDCGGDRRRLRRRKVADYQLSHVRVCKLKKAGTPVKLIEPEWPA